MFSLISWSVPTELKNQYSLRHQIQVGNLMQKRVYRKVTPEEKEKQGCYQKSDPSVWPMKNTVSLFHHFLQSFRPFHICRWQDVGRHLWAYNGSEVMRWLHGRFSYDVLGWTSSPQEESWWCSSLAKWSFPWRTVWEIDEISSKQMLFLCFTKPISMDPFRESLL